MYYRREIDGLRALAVLPVIFFHAGFQTFSGGFVGVDIFFVISGYLITSIILAEMEAGTFTLANFYERRARRILPALFVLMALCLPFAWLWLLPQDMKSFSQSLIAVSTFASNILFWRTSGGYFDTATELQPLLHTWSLAVEEQYYLLFPIFVLLTWRFGKTLILKSLVVVFIISLASAHWGATTHPVFTFFLLPTRGWELLIGGFIAFYFSTGKTQGTNISINNLGSLAGLLLLTYSVFVFDSKTPFPSLYSLVPTIGAALIIFYASPSTFVGKILGSKLFVGVGLISYSAYLYHQPLFAFARHRSLEEPSKLLLGILAVFSILLGYLSWQYIEKPFRNKLKISRTTVFYCGVVGSIFFIAIGLYGHLTKGLPYRLPASSASFLFAANDKNPRQAECHFGTEKFPKPQDSCVLGSLSNIQGALLGDSHADVISYELEKNLELGNLGFLSLTYGGCPPIQNVYRADAPLKHKCNEYNEQTFSFLLKNPKIHYVVLSARWTIYLEKNRYNNTEGGIEDGDDMYIDVVSNGNRKVNNELNRKILIKGSYRTTIENLLQAGKKVIVVYPIPEVGWDVPNRQLKKLLINKSNVEPITTSYSAFKARNKSTIEALDSIPNNVNLIRLRPDKILCNSFIVDRCITQIDSKILYQDDDHLSNAGAKLIVTEIMKSIGKQ